MMHKAIIFWLFLSAVSFADECQKVTQDEVCPDAKTLHQVGCQALGLKESELKAIFKNALAPHIHTLKREVTFYNWESSPTDLSPVEYFKKGIGQGEGVFAAADPLASIDFSGREHRGILLQIQVPAGVKYLDGGLNYEIPGRYSFRIERGKFSLSPEDTKVVECFPESKIKEIIQQVFRESGVQFTIDTWRRSPFRDCPDRAAANSEIIFHNPSIVTRVNVAVLDKSVSRESATVTKKLYERVLGYFDAFDFSSDDTANGRRDPFFEFYNVWAPAIRELPPGTDLVEYQKSRASELRSARKKLISGIFGCSEDVKNSGEVPSSGVSEDEIDAIVQGLKGENYEAANALGDMGKKSVPALLNALKGPDSGMRAMAAYALGQTRAAAAKEGLIKALNDSDSKVRQNAKDALEALSR